MDQMMKERKKGGVQQRLGHRFSEEIEKIKDAKLKNGTAKDRVSTEKISNLIVRNLNWEKISKEIINADEEEVKTYGLAE